MLRHTFCHIPTLGVKSEQKLWDAGIITWDAFLEAERDGAALPLSAQKRVWALEFVQESQRRFEARDAAWFDEHLPAQQKWRLFGDFGHNAGYLDIETTGSGGPYDHVTAIALYHKGRVRSYVHGRNLDAFPAEVMDCSLLVTFNGKCFDLPFLRRAFGIPLGHAHLDLRYALRGLGVTGGLKKCEKHYGLDRGGLDGVDGYDAVLLWREHQRSGDPAALETLLAYNVEDVLSLEHLAAVCYNEHAASAPLPGLTPAPLPKPAPNPFRADPKIVHALRERRFHSF
jgi:uncharacterized protein YprB with RNaseH-like and TPR domain